MDTTDPVIALYAKQRAALRYWLLGAEYHKASAALEFAERYHTGTRKDGTTPELAHQVAIASYVRTLRSGLRHPEETLATCLLHDVREDYDIPDEVIRTLFGDLVANAVGTMTKVFEGVERDPEDVFAAIEADPIASVAKLADRSNNLGSMVGVFSQAKMREYIAETELYFLPMLRAARRRFVDQEPVYENAKWLLHSQLDLLGAVLAGLATT
jgi:(p)ppGpp synthase/HD superfamily hydrolase